MFKVLHTIMKELLNKLDNRFIKIMKSASIPSIRLSFGVIFIWFGILKPLGLSSAEGLLKATVIWLPFGSPEIWLIIIGIWEIVIGVFFFFKSTTRIAIILLFLQMVGTFMPLIVLTDVTFQSNNVFLPTLEGQYIIKNLMIISAALVLGGEITRPKSKSTK
ncbi:DoxX family membrane protein [Polaribacter irgensii]|uniref:DoxX family membrane protein n=1 Tax=Polaribacter irgensii TaxID=531 RepID=UPI000318DFD1|nr:DoxX family membrane protein [Polaribacter irgensii]